jgi:hypothetical protein
MTSKVQRLSRQRFKAMREGKPFDPPAVHADKVAAQLVAAAASDPAPVSRAYRQYWETRAFDRFMELCRTTPVRARRP